jgi:hypothetical protein
MVSHAAFDRANCDRFVDLIAIALRFAWVRANPAADSWEGTGLLDDLHRPSKFPFGNKAHKSLDIVVGWASHHAGRGVLLFGPGNTWHG